MHLLPRMRSYIYKFHGHLIPSHIKRVLVEWWKRWTYNLEALRCWWFESYRGQDFSCNVHLFRVPRSWTGSVQIKSSMTFVRGNRCIEREKDNFKSREVKRLKECALAFKEQPRLLPILTRFSIFVFSEYGVHVVLYNKGYQLIEYFILLRLIRLEYNLIRIKKFTSTSHE